MLINYYQLDSSIVVFRDEERRSSQVSRIITNCSKYRARRRFRGANCVIKV